jgi:hypothetical protein
MGRPARWQLNFLLLRYSTVYYTLQRPSCGLSKLGSLQSTMFNLLVSLLAAYATLACAKTVTYNFDIGWVTAAPDGYSRQVIGINGQWP